MIIDTADTVNIMLADYNFYANFIINNDSDSHVINYFYQNHLTNICSVIDINICHNFDITSVELIDDIYYNMYDQYDHFIQFDIIKILYMSDFIINIISIRLVKQQTNLFFKTQ